MTESDGGVSLASSIKEMALQARKGANLTANYGKSNVGRAVYQANGALSGSSDPGAVAIALFLEGALDILS